MQRRFFLLLIGVMAAAFGVRVTFAQDGNLLRDGGFEGDYTNRGRADFNIPADWNAWVGESPRTESWMNLPPVAFPHLGPDPSPRSGARALNFNKGWATFTVAIYQQVNVQQGAAVQATAFANLKACNIPPNADRCGSAVESGAFTRIGIDPNGGGNPFDGDVVWSSNYTPHDRWDQMSISTTSTGPTVTVFLYASQSWPSQLNNAYFDDASLVVTGAGSGTAPAVSGTPGAPAPTAPPPPPAFANVVSPQNARADGSIVHRVASGDTLDSIAFAYGMTRAEVLAVNPNIRDPRIIQIGQEIIIRPPTDAAESTDEATEATDEAASTDEATEATDEAASTDAADEPSAEATGEALAESTEVPTAAPTALLPEDAPPAPILSVASGEVLPSIDPAAATGSVCVLLFEDLNQNRIQEEGESLLADGEIALAGGGDSPEPYTTDGAGEPYCFGALAAGEYVVSAQPPQGYGLTTPDQLRVRALAGADVNIAFGAARDVVPVVPPPAESGGLVSETPAEATDVRAADPVRDNLGLFAIAAAGIVFVAGMGLALMMRRG